MKKFILGVMSLMLAVTIGISTAVGVGYKNNSKFRADINSKVETNDSENASAGTNDYTKLQEDYYLVLAKKQELENDITGKDSEIETLKAEKQALEIQLETATNDKAELQSQLDAKVQELAQANADKQSLETQLVEANSKIAELEAELADNNYFSVVFFVDNEIYDIQTIKEDGLIEEITPEKAGYTFLGWSLNQEDIDTEIYEKNIKSNLVYYANFVFNDFQQVESLEGIGGGKVWTDGDNIYYSRSIEQYVLNKNTLTWEAVSWEGLFFSLEGNCVWSYGDNTYFSYNGKHYLLNKGYFSWTLVDFSGLYYKAYGYDIWTDGEDFYFDCKAMPFDDTYKYKLDKETNTWSEFSFTNDIVDYGQFIWTDGENTYYSNGSKHYVLDKETDTWLEKTWFGFTGFSGTGIWTDGKNIYYSNGSEHYVLDKETDTWLEKTWTGLTKFSGNNVWHCDGKTYAGDYLLVA